MTLYVPESIRIDLEPRLRVHSAWVDHAPLGYDLVAALEPKIVVELGSHHGFSFAIFCQSVRAHMLQTVCYAVDTWAGDDHTGDYDEQVFATLSGHIREHYRHYAYLLRTRFEQAVSQFENNSIDLLHIDGLHTYDAVHTDFTTWLPKVVPGGVIMFHDIMERKDDFGVWKLWQELSAEYDTCTFTHGHGLGLLRKPGPNSANNTLLHLLFDSTPEEKQALAELYSFAGQFLKTRRQAEKFRQSREKGIKRAMEKLDPKNAVVSSA